MTENSSITTSIIYYYSIIKYVYNSLISLEAFLYTIVLCGSLSAHKMLIWCYFDVMKRKTDEVKAFITQVTARWQVWLETKIIYSVDNTGLPFRLRWYGSK